MLRTRACDLLGIRFPIIGAPLGPTISGPELTAAVSGAGGLGIMSGARDRPTCSATRSNAPAPSPRRRSA
jgi:NAD(P)H-dependent flavin oxidoreductase YrpB (nitropropane dioxygenase family)